MKRMYANKWKKAAIFGIILSLLLPICSVRAEQADSDTVVAAAAKILYNNEGGYQSVNPNDNGALSIGKLQWHASRALSLLRAIVSADLKQAQNLLGNSLYNEITSNKTNWNTRKLTTSEASAVKKLLATNASKAAQDLLAVKDIASYIEQAEQLGITNEPALVYFADLTNQGGSGASARVAASAVKAAGSYAAVTLNELHEAAICDSVMGLKAYQNRRFATYRYAAGLSWVYCSPSDSYIPSDYETTIEGGTPWLQRALNSCMNAGLAVTGNYDETTKSAVSAFQSAKGLEVDGYAGRETIVALIKAVFKSDAVTPDTPNPGTTTDPGSQNPGNTTNPGTTTDPGSQTPGTQNPDLVTPDPNPDVTVKEPTEQAVLKAPDTSYAVNDTQEAFMLKVTSNHSQAPIIYTSSDKTVAVVNNSGQVTIMGAGEAEITVRQAQTDTYKSAQLAISITVYSTNPSDYEMPAGALYAGKNMRQEHVQWLQASLMQLAGEQMDIDGVWTNKTTQQLKKFQKKSGILADGIAGDQTKSFIAQLLTVSAKKPKVTIKSDEKANTLTWKKFAKANRIFIYSKEKGGESYKRIKTIKNMKITSYQDTAAKKGTTYYYVVRFGYIQNKVKVTGPSSKGVAGVIK